MTDNHDTESPSLAQIIAERDAWRELYIGAVLMRWNAADPCGNCYRAAFKRHGDAWRELVALGAELPLIIVSGSTARLEVAPYRRAPMPPADLT